MDKTKTFRLVLAKEYLKFSCAHMTVFSATEKERLHGHNYQVSVEVAYRPEPAGSIIDARAIKTIVSECCAQWDERLLLPANSPYLEILHDGDFVSSLAFQLCGKPYLVPKDEAELLPLENVTVESLAELLGTRFWEQAKTQPWAAWVVELSFEVEETPGQSARFDFVPPASS